MNKNKNHPSIAGALFPLASNLYPGPCKQSDAFCMVKATGEFRPPKQGEWFISGAIPEGYRASGDYVEYSFWIAKKVRFKKVISFIEMEG